MEELTNFSEESKESNFDLKAEIFKYLTYWKWILVGFLLGGLLAYLYNRYTIPKYSTSSTMIMVDDQENSAMSALPSGGGGTILSIGDDGLQSQIEKLKSKQLVSSVIDELDLNISYYIEGNVITVEAYKSSPAVLEFISADSLVNNADLDILITPLSETEFKLNIADSEYSKNHKIGEIINLDEIEFTVLPKSGNSNGAFNKSNTVNVIVEPLRETANRYIQNLLIKPKGKANDILELSIVNESSAKSEDFLNTLMKRFNEEGVANKQEVAENTTAFIQERLEMITTELDSVEVGIAEFKRENRIMNVQSGAQQFQSKFSAAEQQIFDLETQLELLQSIEELLRKKDPYDFLPEVGISEGGITGLINSYNSLVMERNMYLKGSTVNNPVVEALSDQLDGLRSNLYENIASTRQSIRVRLNELSTRGNRAQGQFQTFPGLEKGMRNIERQQQIKEQLYLFLLQRREEAAISFAATASVARVVDSAFTLDNPVDPEPWLILVGGFLVGLIIPIGIIFIKNLLDTKVHHKGDLQTLIKTVPFIGEVPRIGAEQNEVIHLNDRSPLAESFRILRTNLAYLIQNKDKERGDVIFVTSTVKGEGKTFISYNLSRTLASTGKSVLLIGADIRNPKLHRYTESTLGAKEKGLSDFLYDFDVNSEDIVSKTNDDDIDVDIVLSGPIPPNPAELLMNDRMEELIEDARTRYDFIIVDTAPAMIVTDTLLISQLADYTLYVTRADFTEKNLLEFPKDLKKQSKLKGLAVILNDVDYSKFSYGAQYGYSYGYGYGYGVDKESRWKRLKRRLSN
ncbi:capsular exopolysaccharide synthesis family protein [Christiangramia gaetbulicola]|uniref:non-specific protein-tyrosine kinase n=1 Tax=Christiangramia gaetbulicola TaxID=703340 RepID=A0A2T6AFR9_9FLAO|nr:polysaccharide biosynthesis tyrosine autokinase [Christiangramia gaetbulicola]PTX42639.1 capsular exopolysaccharide synthesis family protein [Christiangramia gaetbulicola]